MNFNALIPELSVTDINKSKAFYLSLGFEIKYERPENKFIFLQLEENQIMLEEINGNWSVGEMHYPFGNGINLSMRVSDVAAKYNELKAKGIKMFRELEVHKYRCDDVEYSDSEFLLQDPDEYLLRFNN